MKKIELNAGLKFVLIVLTWLLTFTVTNVSGLISGAGSLIGLLVFYAAILFADFVYFKDECLQKHAKFSLLVMIIILVVTLFNSCLGYTFEFALSYTDYGSKTYKVITNIQKVYDYIFNVARIAVVAVALILVLLKTKDCCAQATCCCDKKEEAKEEKTVKAEEVKDAE